MVLDSTDELCIVNLLRLGLVHKSRQVLNAQRLLIVFKFEVLNDFLLLCILLLMPSQSLLQLLYARL